jgi:SAM-dependent methyltransferase
MHEPAGLVRHRNVASEEIPDGAGVECFDTDAAAALNDARLHHLASLELPLEGRSVLEIGAGVGWLTRFFIERKCRIVATEARLANVEELARRLPEVTVRLADVEQTLTGLGRFEVVFCYGVLYHLENPLLALRNMAEVCDELLLLETHVCDSRGPILMLEDEPKSANQALRGLAHRPSPSYVTMALNRIGFEHVYESRRRPSHPDFNFEWRDSGETTRAGHLLRATFVASRHALDSPHLVPLICTP